jgi:hypothetical protein
MCANGPAIKNSKRCGANGGCDHKFVIGVESRHTTVMSEAWRGFCKSRYKFYEVYECRGTNLKVDWY